MNRLLQTLCSNMLQRYNCYNNRIEDWTILDIKIINCCLHFFEPETYISLAEQLVKSLKKYNGFSDISSLEASIYLNLTLLFLIDNDTLHEKNILNYL